MSSESPQWISVCEAKALIPNIGACALVKGRQIAIFELDKVDGLFAIDNYDPFSKANVLSRGLVGDLKGQYVVASPIYKQHFNLETGNCLEDETVSVKTYPVRKKDGQIELAV